MIIHARNFITPDSALGGIQIDNSLRFEGDDTTYLSASPTFNTKKYTFSFWMKPVKKGDGAILSYNMVGNNRHSYSYDTYEGHFANQLRIGGSTQSQYAAAAAFRDFASWYHVVFVWDSDNGTQADRFIVYVNGVRAEMTQYTGTSSGVSGYIGGGNTIYIGRSTDGYSPARFYLADYHLIDGQAYDASYFGFTDAQTGQWRPKIYTGSYGSGGFHLEFKDSSNLGKDTSGNANNWTANNFSVSAGAGKDLVTDTPTNNFPTLNPLDSSGNVSTQGNLQGGTAGTSGWRHTRSTVVLPSSGKWYWEYKIPTAATDGSNGWMTGIAYSNLGFTQDINSNSTGLYGRQTQGKYNNSSGSPVTDYHFTTVADNDILQFAYDADSQTLFTGKNNTWEQSANPSTGANPNWTSVASGGFPMVGSYGSSKYVIINFGQQGFSYTPPTGYRALNSKNLATPVAAGVVNPQSHFETLLYTGNNSTQKITGLKFKPDFIWFKNRGGTSWNALFDSVRGNTQGLAANETNTEYTSSASNDLVSFDISGFTLGSNQNWGSVNGSSNSIVAWCWKGGGTAASNTDGTITSSVSANTEAGFSIVSYTGNETNNATVGHGLGKSPDWVIIKDRDSNTAGNNWYVFHSALASGHYVKLNQTSATTAVSGTSNGGVGSVTSTTFNFVQGTTGNNKNVNENGDRFIAYCWTSIPGYSSMGSYTGISASGTDGTSNGPYIHCGFKPAWILIKQSSGTNNWVITDIKRDTQNPTTGWLYPDLGYQEETDSGRYLDILSTGFKIRSPGSSFNTDGATYIYVAFAERPSGTGFGLDANSH